MRRRVLLGFVPVLMVIASRAFAGATPSPQRALEDVALVIEQSFPDLAHLTPVELQNFVKAGGAEPAVQIVLLDVRSAEEFAVSRIDGAVRVDPSARSTTAITALTGSLEGKIVVAYCSIGLRSARLLVRIGQSLKDRGAVRLFNLRGGVFQWHNEQRPLVAVSGATQRMHTYNAGWRQYLVGEP